MSSSGERFIVARPVAQVTGKQEAASVDPIVVVLNWAAGFKR
jgi:hypothetical protein